MTHTKTTPLEIYTNRALGSERRQTLTCGTAANDHSSRLSEALDDMVTALQNQSLVVDKFRKDNLILTEAMERLQQSAEQHEEALALIAKRATGRP